MNPKVSIIVPIYNTQEFLKKCIDSILSQTLKEIEVILVDDGSSDNSGVISDDYAAIDNRVNVIHQKNSGPSAARNNGIKFASGEYIGFVDSDDWIDNGMYEALYNAAAANSVNLAMCNYKEQNSTTLVCNIITHSYNDNEILDKERIRKEIIPSFARNEVLGFYCMYNKIYKKDWILNLKLELDESRDHGEDWWFNIEVFTAAENVVFLSEAFYNYTHVNQESLMVKYRPNQFELVLSGRKRLIKKLTECGVDINNYKKELDERFLYETISCVISKLSNIERRSTGSEELGSILTNEEVREVLKSYFGGSFHVKLLIVFMNYKMVRMLKMYTYIRNILYKCRFIKA